MNRMMEYRGYHAQIDYDADDALFVGKVYGITDSLNFHGTSVQELEDMFHQSVDNYLSMCAEVGKTPNKEFKGSFNVRIPPELHREISIQAVRHGIRGKDSGEISDGNIVIRCGKDGLRATNTKDSDKGFISISGGKISIVCGDDPLDYVTGLSVTGGTIEASVRPSGED